MLTPKSKMLVRLAVEDYIKMFPQEYEEVMRVLEYDRQNLANEMAAIKDTHHVKRHVHELPEKLYWMIMKKLSEKEGQEFGSKDSTRWFVKEFPQFAITKYA